MLLGSSQQAGGGREAVGAWALGSSSRMPVSPLLACFSRQGYEDIHGRRAQGRPRGAELTWVHVRLALDGTETLHKDKRHRLCELQFKSWLYLF